MNIALLDPFESNIPAQVTATLRNDSIAVCCAFNRRGTLLAAGTIDGKCLVFDLYTSNVKLILNGHVHIVVNVSWSRNGKYLITSSLDWNVIKWDINSGRRLQTLRFGSPLITGILHPRSNDIIAVLATQEPPIIVQNETRTAIIFPESRNSSAATALAFTPNGKYIYIGTNKGYILVYAIDGNYEFEIKVSASAIKNININRSGTEMVTNSNDRIIRHFYINDQQINPGMKFVDSVERSQWLECRLSADGEYAIGACGSGNRHDLYIWDKLSGVLSKMLQGPFEGMSAMTWHPIRPIAATISSYNGAIYIWTNVSPQKYSAYDPTFVDIEDNIEYDEKEDEFDVVIDKPASKIVQEEQVYVDVTTVETLQIISDTEDELE